MLRYLIKKAVSFLAESDSKYPVKIVFADGTTHQNVPGTADVAIIFRRRAAEWKSILFDYVGFVESYLDGDIDIEGEDALRKLIRMTYELSAKKKSGTGFFRNPLIKIRQMMQERKLNARDYAQAKRNAYAHYALPQEFFHLMNGDLYGYTEGYYENGDEGQDEAQYKKYDYMCRKLCLKKGDKLVEVGSAWGTMALVAAGKYGAEVVNYGLVEDQNRIMQKRIDDAELSDKIQIVAKDARELKNEPEKYDKYVSLGVYEHAGKDCQREWIESIAAGLKPGGIGVIATTGRMKHQLTDYVIAKYIWPGAYLPSLSRMLELMEEYGLNVVDIENSRFHYAHTMEVMLKKLQDNWPKIQTIDPRVFTEGFRRMWTIYYLGSIETFRGEGQIMQAFQITFVKGRKNVYPMSRKFLYT